MNQVQQIQNLSCLGQSHTISSFSPTNCLPVLQNTSIGAPHYSIPQKFLWGPKKHSLGTQPKTLSLKICRYQGLLLWPLIFMHIKYYPSCSLYMTELLQPCTLHLYIWVYILYCILLRNHTMEEEYTRSNHQTHQDGETFVLLLFILLHYFHMMYYPVVFKYKKF